MMHKRILAIGLGLALLAGACSSADGEWADTTTDRYDPPPTTTGRYDAEETTTTYASEPYPDVSFDNPGVNRPMRTEDDAVSTFALDVDTGSYSVARRFVDDGHLPDPDSVRVEEYVNYFDQGYPSPRSGVFAVYVDGAPTPYASDERSRVIRIGIQAEEIADRDRKDASLTFVVDTSGSMAAENRLGGVRWALAQLVEELRPTDTVALVEYGSEARVVMEPTRVRDRDRILDRIDSLRPNGSTNAAAGLDLGYRLARDAYVDRGINRVILASDGVANVGVTDAEGILDLIREDADDGIQLVTVGFGMGNYNDTFMEQLADNGDGFYAYVDTLEEAERLFVEDLTGTLQTVAMDARVQVEFDPDAVSEWRLVGYENRHMDDRDFRNDSVDAGEIGAGHTVTALYEVRLDRDVEYAPSLRDLGTFSLRWHEPGSDETREISRPIEVDDLADRFQSARPRFQLAVFVAEYAEILRGDGRAYFSGTTLDDLAEDLWRFDELADDADVREFIDLVESAARIRR
ncbi:MAG: von Willebrand factor type A domain-containing protein [Actinomycetota bacterium]